MRVPGVAVGPKKFPACQAAGPRPAEIQATLPPCDLVDPTENRTDAAEYLHPGPDGRSEGEKGAGLCSDLMTPPRNSLQQAATTGRIGSLRNRHTRLPMTKTHKLTERGEQDFKAGQSIDAFYQLPLKRHTELNRGRYEIGWKAAELEARKARSAINRAANK